MIYNYLILIMLYLRCHSIALARNIPAQLSSDRIKIAVLPKQNTK